MLPNVRVRDAHDGIQALPPTKNRAPGFAKDANASRSNTQLSKGGRVERRSPTHAQIIFTKGAAICWLPRHAFRTKVQLIFGMLFTSGYYCTGISSRMRTELRNWTVRQARASCYSRTALSSNDSKTLNEQPVMFWLFQVFESLQLYENHIQPIATNQSRWV